MKFSLDVNVLFKDAIAAMQGGAGVLIVFGLITLLMLPWLIPAASNAIAQHRRLSHQREQNMLKIRNSREDRAKKRIERDG